MIIKLLLLVIVSSLLIVGAEMLKRRLSLPTSVTRRAIHIGTGIVAGLSPLVATREEIILVSIAFAAVMLAARRYKLFTAVHAVERKTAGEAMLPLGVAATALLFLPHNIAAFQFGVFVMGISDGLAGLIGEYFGRHTVRFFDNKKSLEGSAAFFASCLILAFLFAPAAGYELLLIPVLLTAIEFCFIYGLDNLVLPIAGAYLLQHLP